MALRLLLRGDLDVNCVNQDGDCALAHAVAHGNAPAVRGLLAKSNTKVCQTTDVPPLPIRQQLHSVFLAQVDVVDQRLRTPLLLAVKAGDPVCVALLLDAGADLLAEDEHGEAQTLRETSKSWTIKPDPLMHLSTSTARYLFTI
jgi:ankyrin repeat protein